MKYRSEILWGEGCRDASSVMAHETFSLENTDIVSTLAETILKNSPIRNKLMILQEELNNLCIADGDDGSLFSIVENYEENIEKGIEFFKEVLLEIQKLTGKDIKYCLWLCDSKADVHNYDMDNCLSDDDIDIYEESDIILSDIGTDGKLYGYEYYPKPLSL